MESDKICENKTWNNDPWAPQSELKPLSMPFVKDPRRDMQSSESYIASLESKLARIKGKKCTSKDMLKSLKTAKQDHIEHIAPSVDYSFVEENTSTSRLAELQRRIAPQQALTADELHVLVENDELAKLMESISLEMEMEHLKASIPEQLNAIQPVETKQIQTAQSVEQEKNQSVVNNDGDGNDAMTQKEALHDEEKDVCEKTDSENEH